MFEDCGQAAVYKLLVLRKRTCRMYYASAEAAASAARRVECAQAEAAAAREKALQRAAVELWQMQVLRAATTRRYVGAKAAA